MGRHQNVDARAKGCNFPDIRPDNFLAMKDFSTMEARALERVPKNRLAITALQGSIKISVDEKASLTKFTMTEVEKESITNETNSTNVPDQTLKAENDIESFQGVLVDSINEAKQVQSDFADSNLLIDTIKDIGNAASITVATIREWSEKQQQENPDVPVKQSQDHKIEEDQLSTFDGGQSLLAPETNWACSLWEDNPLVSKRSLASNEDDTTVDTIQAEKNQIRRLGSWNTINTSESYSTGDHQRGTYTDDENRKQAPNESQPKRKVKFEYPPVNSLRTYPRPDPESLPNLYFTEEELDQIEGDREAMKSTDDIEIIAVTTKKSSTSLGQSDTSNGNQDKKHFSKGRWNQDDNEEKKDEDSTTSKKKDKRLVKGVQIFLRERSTGP